MKLTRPQYAMLKRVAEGNSPYPSMRSRAGGAISRMCDKLAHAGLFEWGMYGAVVTKNGHKVIEAYEKRRKK